MGTRCIPFLHLVQTDCLVKFSERILPLGSFIILLFGGGTPINCYWCLTSPYHPFPDPHACSCGHVAFTSYEHATSFLPAQSSTSMHVLHCTRVLQQLLARRKLRILVCCSSFSAFRWWRFPKPHYCVRSSLVALRFYCAALYHTLHVRCFLPRMTSFAGLRAHLLFSCWIVVAKLSAFLHCEFVDRQMIRSSPLTLMPATPGSPSHLPFYVCWFKFMIHCYFIFIYLWTTVLPLCSAAWIPRHFHSSLVWVHSHPTQVVLFRSILHGLPLSHCFL